MWEKNNQSNFARMRIDYIKNCLKLIPPEYRLKSELILIPAFRLIDEWHFFPYKQKLMFLTRRDVFLLSIDFFSPFHPKERYFSSDFRSPLSKYLGKAKKLGESKQKTSSYSSPFAWTGSVLFLFFFSRSPFGYSIPVTPEFTLLRMQYGLFDVVGHKWPPIVSSYCLVAKEVDCT